MGKKLFIGNLPFSTTDDILNEVFSQAGQVASAKVIMDRSSGRSKGFGFVEMATDAEAAEAITKFNGAELDGRALTVAEAKPETPREERPRGGGRGGFGGGGGGGGGRDRGPRY